MLCAPSSNTRLKICSPGKSNGVTRSGQETLSKLGMWRNVRRLCSSWKFTQALIMKFTSNTLRFSMWCLWCWCLVQACLYSTQSELFITSSTIALLATQSFTKFVSHPVWVSLWLKTASKWWSGPHCSTYWMRTGFFRISRSSMDGSFQGLNQTYRWEPATTSNRL